MRIVPLVVALLAAMAASDVSATRETSWMTDANLVNQRRLYWQAVQAMEEARYTDAARMFDRLNELPLAFGLFQPAGVAHLRAGNLRNAEVSFGRALRVDPRSAEAQLGLGLVYVQQGRRAEAEELLRTLEKRQKRCASACERADEIDRATEVLARALG